MYMYEIMHHDDAGTIETAETLDSARVRIAAKHARHLSEVGLDDRSSSMGTVEQWSAWLAGGGEHADPVATIARSPRDPRADVTLSEQQASALRREDDRQAADCRIGALTMAEDWVSQAERIELQRFVCSVDSDAEHCAMMAEVCGLQDALPSGAVLRYPDGKVARRASVDLAPPPGYEDRAVERALREGVLR